MDCQGWLQRRCIAPSFTCLGGTFDLHPGLHDFCHTCLVADRCMLVFSQIKVTRRMRQPPFRWLQSGRAPSTDQLSADFRILPELRFVMAQVQHAPDQVGWPISQLLGCCIARSQRHVNLRRCDAPQIGSHMPIQSIALALALAHLRLVVISLVQDLAFTTVPKSPDKHRHRQCTVQSTWAGGRSCGRCASP